MHAFTPEWEALCSNLVTCFSSQPHYTLLSTILFLLSLSIFIVGGHSEPIASSHLQIATNQNKTLACLCRPANDFPMLANIAIHQDQERKSKPTIFPNFYHIDIMCINYSHKTLSIKDHLHMSNSI